MIRLEAAFPGEPELAEGLSAVASLHAADLEIRSSAPLPHRLAPVESRFPWVLVAALSGGLVFGLGAFALAAGTATAYPLVTGGMPIVSGPPFGIITYEGTALGVIVSTVLAVFLGAKLYRRPPYSPLAPRLAEGHILLSLSVAEEQVPEIERRLQAAGAVQVAEVVVDGGQEHDAMP